MRIRNLIAVAGVTVGIFGGAAAPAQADTMVGACAEYQTPVSCTATGCDFGPGVYVENEDDEGIVEHLGGPALTERGEMASASVCVDTGL